MGGGGGGGGLRGVAGFAAFRACLGEVSIGPWRRETPVEFEKIEDLRAVEVACVKKEDGDDGEAGVVVALSLEWKSRGIAGGALGEVSRWSTLHCDVWQGSGEAGGVGGNAGGDAGRVGSGGGGGGGRGDWKWLGRAYGRKYRLSGLNTRAGKGEAALVLAVQQVNAMGYREVNLMCLCVGLKRRKELRMERQRCSKGALKRNPVSISSRWKAAWIRAVDALTC